MEPRELTENQDWTLCLEGESQNPENSICTAGEKKGSNMAKAEEEMGTCRKIGENWVISTRVRNMNAHEDAALVKKCRERQH